MGSAAGRLQAAEPRAWLRRKPRGTRVDREDAAPRTRVRASHDAPGWCLAPCARCARDSAWCRHVRRRFDRARDCDLSPQDGGRELPTSASKTSPNEARPTSLESARAGASIGEAARGRFAARTGLTRPRARRRGLAVPLPQCGRFNSSGATSNPRSGPMCPYFNIPRRKFGILLGMFGSSDPEPRRGPGPAFVL